MGELLGDKSEMKVSPTYLIFPDFSTLYLPKCQLIRYNPSNFPAFFNREYRFYKMTFLTITNRGSPLSKKVSGYLHLLIWLF
jgi:hypothetical protein